MKHIKQIIAYTDGSLRREKGGIKCGYGVYYEGDILPRISRPFTRAPITNNRAELYAVYRAIRVAAKNVTFDRITIFCDSQLTVNSLTSWIDRWRKNGWKTANGKTVKNQDLIKAVYALMCEHDVVLKWVRAHVGTEGNEIADELANKGASKS